MAPLVAWLTKLLLSWPLPLATSSLFPLAFPVSLAAPEYATDFHNPVPLPHFPGGF